jgi:Domain of unknown function (DUF1929)
MLHSASRTLVSILVAISFLWCSGPLAGQLSVVGQWSQPYDWGVNGVLPNEFGHATLLLTGLNPGQLLIWNVPGPPFPQTTWLWDPALPKVISPILNPPFLASSIYCASHTARADGKVLVCGGLPMVASPPPLPPTVCVAPVPFVPCAAAAWSPPQLESYCHPCSTTSQSWLFDPATTSWSPTQTPMVGSRYYPSQVATCGVSGAGPVQLARGDPIVIAGTLDQFCGEYDPAYWPTVPASLHRHVDGRFTRGWEYIDSASNNYVQVGPSAGPVGWPAWTTTTPPPLYFRYFPQMFMMAAPTLANPTVFIAGDTHVQFAFPPLPPGGPPNNPPCHQVWQAQNVVQSSYKLNVATSTLTTAGANGPPNYDRYYGSAVILVNSPQGTNRVLRFGGSNGTYNSSQPLGPADSVKEWDDSVAQTWLAKTSLVIPRMLQNAVVLPTGKILIVGGSSKDYHNTTKAAQPVLDAEIYDPGSTPASPGSSILVAPHSRARVYHSVAALLPDARVAFLGGHNVAPLDVYGESRDSVEIYSPPYLFQGTRPTINSVGACAYNQTATVNATIAAMSGSPIEVKAVLMRPASATHHFDFDQRYVEIDISPPQVSSGTQNLTLTWPLNETHAPPGFYMLFIVQTAGGVSIPSVAATVQLP